MASSMQYGTQVGATPFCLGQPPHTLQSGELVCRTCGALADGTHVGIYQIRTLLGRGRGGWAYLAIHQRSSQPVVLKLTPPDTISPLQWNLWDAVRREIRVATAVRHPSILPVFSCSAWQADIRATTSPLMDQNASSYNQNTHLLTLSQYAPDTLSHLVTYFQQPETHLALKQRGTTPSLVLLNLLQQAGTALSAAHAKGIVHGAIVPGNILLAGYERLWIADFGLGKLRPPQPPYLPPELYAASHAYSQAGNISGYWSSVNTASDQYMFAVLCQQLLSQTLPAEEYERWRPLLQKAMQPRPDRRYPSLDLFLADMAAVLSGPLHSLQPQALGLPAGVRRSGIQRSQTQQVPTHYEHASSPSHQRHPVAVAPVTPALPLSGPHYTMMPITPAPVEISPFLATPPVQAPVTPIIPHTVLTADDWEKRGGKLFTMRDYEEALAAYHRALEMKGDKFSVWLALGDTYFALERHKEALMAYEQAMYLNSDDPQVWLNRGTALDALGRHQEALDCYERAEQLQ